MLAIRSINNNVAICIDAGGNECVAMGKGIGFGKMPRDVALSEVTHTYYSVDLRLLEGIKEIPQDVLLFAARAAEHVRAELSYALSPNMAFLLADHIAFAIKRAREHLQVRMPLAYDVEHNYPEEYRVGQRLVRQIRKEFLVDLGDDEAAGIAMNLVNSRFESVSEQDAARSQSDDIMLEEITEFLKQQPVKKAYMQGVIQGDRKGCMFVLEHQGKDEAIFGGIARIAQPYMQGMYLYMATPVSDLGQKAIEGLEPFYEL